MHRSFEVEQNSIVKFNLAFTSLRAFINFSSAEYFLIQREAKATKRMRPGIKPKKPDSQLTMEELAVRDRRRKRNKEVFRNIKSHYAFLSK